MRDNNTVINELSNEFSYDEQSYIDNWKLNFRNFISKNVRGYLYNQNKIDSILDKISESGYDSLSKQEKEYLFNAGKKK